MAQSDILKFLRAWLSAPLQIGAVVPSSLALATAITCEISEDTGFVVELGPGTGVFTRALIAHGVPEHRLILIEASATFAALLRQRFPAARVLHMDARHLKKLRMPEGERVGAVVSGLPLLSMSARKVFAIVTGAFSQLQADGSFYQFTYGMRSPVVRPILERMELKALRIGGTWANFPPASVYRIQRKPAAAAAWAKSPAQPTNTVGQAQPRW